MRQILFTVIALFFLTALCYSQSASIVINEILFFQDVNSTEKDRDHEWVEIFNKGNEEINLSGWTLTNRNAFPLMIFPDIELPPNAYLVIHFRQGNSDLDFSDGMGDLYTQSDHLIMEAFSNKIDEVALFSGTPNSANIIDFLGWKAGDGESVGGIAYNFAVDAGIWEEGDFFEIESQASSVQGDSIGRGKDSLDLNSPEDWDITGGPNAIDITPVAQNLSSLSLLSGAPLPVQNNKKWTVMVYLNADNHREALAWIDFNEMEEAGSNENVNVVVMIDWNIANIDVKASVDGGANFFPTDHTWRGYLKKETTNPKRITLFPPQGETTFLDERNMGNPDELNEFINYGLTHFPADNYALIIWTPGGGWKWIAKDELAPGSFPQIDDELLIGELDQAFKQPQPINKIFDVVGFDADYMGMIEVAHQVYDHARVFVGSQNRKSNDGWPYEAIISNLKLNTSWNANQFGAQIVSEYEKHYENKIFNPFTTLSAVALNNQFENLVETVSGFADDLVTGLEDYNFNFGVNYNQNDNVQIKIRNALQQTEFFGDLNYIDLSHFAELIWDNQEIPNNYKGKAPTIVSLIEGGDIIIAESNATKNQDVHGLSIYFPEYQTKQIFDMDAYDEPFIQYEMQPPFEPLEERYSYDKNDCIPPPENHPHPPASNFHFPNETKWDEFLHRYYEPVADAGEDLTVFVGQVFNLDGSGSSDSDGQVTRWIWDLDANINSIEAEVDWDKDCVDESNDDNDKEGESIYHSYATPGVYTVTLTVWDDHHQQEEHEEHKETDQDEAIIIVLPLQFGVLDIEKDVVGSSCHAFDDGLLTLTGTLGEWMVETLDSNETFVCQGFHQGGHVTVYSSEEFEEVDIQVFPNPTSALVQIHSSFAENLKIVLFDVSGKVLINKDLPYSIDQEVLDLNTLPAGTFFLKFLDEKNKLISIFKIQKI